ncbi:MAG TPA: glycosyltransferase [Casimicrobiaceae bacterium]|nr:glycosyltransferase [Casimicrobiaceae bacterium]
MPERLQGARILIYSHDTFGLGHLRRCREIAHSLVERFKGLSVLILSGSPIIGSYDFRARVDFVRIPGVIKLHNGEYKSLGLHIDLDQTLEMREAIIRHTAEAFRPNLFLVDKEPLGFKGEVVPTLAMLRSMGTRLVLGLRDIMDEPALLSREWEHKQVMPALDAMYDEIWVYGLQAIADPLAGLDCPATVLRKMTYTGYLRRTLPHVERPPERPFGDTPYLLVTVGGGGDGPSVIDWVLSAYEHDPDIPHPALVVLGPFMTAARQREFHKRADALGRVRVLTFDSHLELMMANAAGIVAMGGYNTFCEILSFDRPALLIPRKEPRREQLLRAVRATELGLTRMLDIDSGNDPAVMARALRALPLQPRPSVRGAADMLRGLEQIARLASPHLPGRRKRQRDAAALG